MDYTPEQMLWIALSDLFLDTDVSIFYGRIIKEIHESGLTDEQVKTILMDKVAPALAFNVIELAGEWAGFSEHFVVARIEQIKNQPIRYFVNKLALKKYVNSIWKELMAVKASQP